MTGAPDDIAPMPLDPDSKRRRRARSIAIAVALAGLVVLFYVVTLVRLGGNVASRTF